MGQLLAKIKAKEDDARQRIEQFEQTSNLKAFLEAQKKLLDQFKFVDSNFGADILEFAKTKAAIVKEKQTLKETQCIKDMQEIHSKIEAILKDNIDKFN